MKLLLNTHVLLWAVLEPAKLSTSLRDLLGLFVVDHRDPFNRLLAAQAMAENLILASNNGAFDQFERLKRLS